MRYIDGKALAQTLRDEVAKRAAKLKAPPKLAVLLVGEDAASHTYVSLKEKAAAEVGILTDIRRLPATTPDVDLLAIIAEWNADPSVNGILIQVPLPPGHETDALIASMDPRKDADGFQPANVLALLTGQSLIISPVHEGVLRLIAATGMDVRQKRAALIANSEIFAAPLAHILGRAGFFVDRMSADDMDLDALGEADAVIIAVGKPYALTGGMVKDGAVVIDVGTTRLPNGRIVGDTDPETFEQKGGWITPVPGGVGPMTIALLLKNVVDLTERQQA